MKLIQSFSVDHTKIVPGIFFSRQDVLGKEKVTTYDIRLKRPNIEPAIDVKAMHTLEHIIATYLRNDKKWKDKIVYWGPMGCLTGFYLILKGDFSPKEVYPIILSAFKSVAKSNEVPGATEKSCGNYRLHDLELAKKYAKEFADYLEKNAYNDSIFEYPKSDRPITNDGKNFYDS